MKVRLKEWHRTVVLIVLLCMAIGYIVYLRTDYQTGLENILR